MKYDKSRRQREPPNIFIIPFRLGAPKFMIPQRTLIENPGKIRQKNEKTILDSAEIEFAKYGYEGATIKSIAERAGLPKANIHYYFKSKLDLYAAVLNDILDMWNAAFDGIDIHSNPAHALEHYIRAKVEYSRTHGRASRIFACEMISGAPYLRRYLQNEFHYWVSEKAQVIHHWIRQGLIAPIHPMHLFMMIWGATQYLADAQVQVESLLRKPELAGQDYEAFASDLVTVILKGCGLQSYRKTACLTATESSLEFA